MSKRLQIARSYWAAEKSRDIDLILSHFSQDALFRSPTMTLKGVESIAMYYRDVLSSFEDVDVTVLRAAEDGDVLMVEWLGVLRGTDGKTREVQGCNVFQIARDSIDAMNVYFNAADFD